MPARPLVALSICIFALGIGEELWQAFLPKYLVELGASALAVGLFASLKDLLDGLYQYPGGWLADRLGRKRALLLFTGLAASGYLVYATAPDWRFVFAGLVLVMAWKAGAFPATFAVIGDALPKGQRTPAFIAQSILVRVPRVIGAPIGGLLIGALGLILGLRVTMGIAVLLGLVALLVLFFLQEDRVRSESDLRPMEPLAFVLPAVLKKLLFAECLLRFGEAIAASFILLFITDQLGIPASTYGLFYAVQQSVALVSYLPSQWLTRVLGEKKTILLSFLAFSLFPVAVRGSRTVPALIAAFVVGGLKEIGEPVRKAFIVDEVAPEAKARAVGAYYTVRNLVIVPAGGVGGVLWGIAPGLPLLAAGGVGFLGVAAFVALVRPDGR